MIDRTVDQAAIWFIDFCVLVGCSSFTDKYFCSSLAISKHLPFIENSSFDCFLIFSGKDSDGSRIESHLEGQYKIGRLFSDQ